MKKKARRKYRDEFNAEAVKRVTDQGYKTSETTRYLRFQETKTPNMF